VIIEERAEEGGDLRLRYGEDDLWSLAEHVGCDRDACPGAWIVAGQDALGDRRELAAVLGEELGGLCGELRDDGRAIRQRRVLRDESRGARGVVQRVQILLSAMIPASCQRSG
jgi:hypothetical protein